MPKGHVHEKAEEAKNRKDQAELLASVPTETLPEVAALFGIHEDQIPENATREQLIELIKKAQRHDIQVAKTVAYDGKDTEVPVGFALIRVTPKNGQEWGKKTKEFFFAAMNGVAIVGKRGVPVLIPERYLSCFTDAKKKVYEQDQESLKVDYNRNGASLIETEEYAEDFAILFHNPDVEAEKRKQEELKANSELFQREKKARESYKRAMIENFGNPA
jgi:hypothetical protein